MNIQTNVVGQFTAIDKQTNQPVNGYITKRNKKPGDPDYYYAYVPKSDPNEFSDRNVGGIHIERIKWKKNDAFGSKKIIKT